MRAVPLGLRLFLEGVEVPVISAVVNIQPSTPSTASIQIVPTDAALKFLPRTLVHLFYLDDHITDEDAIAAKQRLANAQQNNAEARGDFGPPPPSVSADLNRLNASDENYRLLYAGEVVGFTFVKSSTARNLVLQCMDLSTHWDTCYQWYADYSVHGSGFTDRTHIFCQAGSGLFDNITGGASWRVSQMLNSRPKNRYYSSCTGLLGGIINVLEMVGGVRSDMASYHAVRGVNDFHTVAELRYNLMGMVGAVDGDKTSARLYSSRAFRAWLTNGMTSMGSLVSFRDILRHISRWVFHDIYPNPVALYVPPNTRMVDKISIVKKAGLTRTSKRAVDKTIKLLEDAITQLQLANSSTENTGASASPYKTYFKRLNAAEALLSTIFEDERNTEEMLSIAQEAIFQVNSAKEAPPIDDPPRVASYRAFLEAAIGSLKELQVKGRARTRKSKEPEKGAHLFNQLILPETFFMTPPRCNVIFPDQYTDFQYSRNFMREVSRLSCGSGLGWIAGGGIGPKCLASYYFAPNIKDADGQSLHTTLREGARVLLPHEVHSGIIPKMEWVSDAHRWGVRAAKADNKERKINYIQKLANFQFFMNRWAPRSISLNARFSPQLVLGLPSLVLDRSSPSPAAMKQIEDKLGITDSFPTQYLGKITSLTHNISQAGGSTAVQLSYCRTHKGDDDEFLGALESGLSTNRRTNRSEYTVTIDTKEMATNRRYTVGGRPNVELKRVMGAVTKHIAVSRKLTATRNELLEAGVPQKEIESLQPVNTTGELYTTGETRFVAESYVVPDSWARQFSTTVARGAKDEGFPGGKIDNAEVGDDVTQLTRSEYAVLLGNAHEGDSSISSQLEGPGYYEFGQVSKRREKYIYFPSKITISYSTYKQVQAKPTAGSFRVEDILQQDWYDDVWSPKNIGQKVYKQLLGCGAIIDDPNLIDFTSVSKKYKNENIELLGTINEPGSLSLHQAIDGLSAHYGLLRASRANIHEFIRTYTRRPVATLPEIMGSSNYDVATGTGTEGFHSRAFGDYNTDVVFVEGSRPKAGSRALEQLGVDAGSPNRNRFGNAVKTPIPKYIDPRGRARQRVLAYMAELNFSRGLQGA